MFQLPSDRPRHRRPPMRRGFSLLELIIATSMLAMLLTSISIVMRAGRESWNAHEADFTRIEAAHSVLRHIVRQIRAADVVTEVTDASNNSGRLGLRMQNGDVLVWAHDNTNKRVDYGITNPNELLALEVTGLRFRGFEADGVTPTTTAADVQCLQVEVTIELPRDVNGQRIVTSWGWIRSW